MTDTEKIYVLLAETRRCINNDQLIAAERKITAIENLLNVSALRDLAGTPNTVVRDRETGEIYSVALMNEHGVSLNKARPNGIDSRWVSDELFKRNFEVVEAGSSSLPEASIEEVAGCVDLGTADVGAILDDLRGPASLPEGKR